MKKRCLRKMLGKRILACSLAVVLAFGMTACGSRDDDEYEEEYEDEDDEDESQIVKIKKVVQETRLPKAGDGLSKEIAMSLNSEVKIKYPRLMEAEAEKDSNVITFSSSNKKGTDDEFSFFKVMLIDLDENEQTYIDSLMEQGPGVATHYMREITEMYMWGTFADYEMEMIDDADDFVDLKNSYVFGCPVEVYESGFEDAPEDMYGCLYVEYVGSSGYLVVGCMVAPERRAEAYLNISAKMMCSVSTDMEWSTDGYAKSKGLEAPVNERPKAPKAEKSRSGDDEDDEDEDTLELKFEQNKGTYFWADSKDNCWRYDGKTDTFWSDGLHGYVDKETGEWFEDWDFVWPELKYSDYQGGNADDDFSEDDDEEDYDEEDYYDEDDSDYYDEDDSDVDDEDDTSDEYYDDEDGGVDDGGNGGDPEPPADGWYYEDGWYIEGDEW